MHTVLYFTVPILILIAILIKLARIKYWITHEDGVLLFVFWAMLVTEIALLIFT